MDVVMRIVFLKSEELVRSHHINETMLELEMLSKNWWNQIASSNPRGGTDAFRYSTLIGHLTEGKSLREWQDKSPSKRVLAYGEDLVLPFLAVFVIVDYESDPRCPPYLGRPFFRETTAQALIDVHWRSNDVTVRW
ncbi:hypothetical protein Tco_0670020 [Tanacetum coccineum]